MKRWWWTLAVVVGHALVQTLLVLSDLVPALSVAFALATVASAAALLVAVWFLANLAVGEVPWARPAVLVRVVLLAVVAVALSLLSPLLVPLVLVVAGPVLVPGALRTTPVRAVLLLVGSLVLAVLSWAAALLAGLFVGGPVGALVTWLWFGAVTAVVLRGWAALSRSRGGTRVDVRADPDATAVGAEQSHSHGHHD